MNWWAGRECKLARASCDELWQISFLDLFACWKSIQMTNCENWSTKHKFPKPIVSPRPVIITVKSIILWKKIRNESSFTHTNTRCPTWFLAKKAHQKLSFWIQFLFLILIQTETRKERGKNFTRRIFAVKGQWTQSTQTKLIGQTPKWNRKLKLFW